MAQLAQDEHQDTPAPFIEEGWIDLDRIRDPQNTDDLGCVQADDRACPHYEYRLAHDPAYQHDAWLDAGPRAECRVRRWSSIAGYLSFHKGGDFQRARRKVLVQRDGRTEGERMDAAWDEAGVLVRRHWPAITALAEALVARAHLDGDEVEAIVADAMPTAFPDLQQRLAGWVVAA